MACDCTAFTAREIGFPRSVGFLRGGMVAFLLHRCEHSNEKREQRGLGKRNAEFVFGFCETLNSPYEKNPKESTQRKFKNSLFFKATQSD